MSNFIKYVFPILFSLSAFSQDNCYYAYNEKLTGKCELFYDDGSLKSSTEFKDGLRNGAHKEYYPDGQIAAIAIFEEEDIVGNLYRFYPDSSIQIEILLDDTGSGEFHYYNNQGTLIREGQFVHSYRDGVWKEYSELGALKSEEVYSVRQTKHEEIWSADMLNSQLGGKNVVMNSAEHVEGIFLDEYGLEIEYDDDAIVSDPEVSAQFSGGTQKMREYIMENVRYPAEAIENNISGKVYVSFIVNRDGSLEGMRILKSVNNDLEKEAIRLVSNMPNWIPAEHRGKTVREQCILPITFTL